MASRPGIVVACSIDHVEEARFPLANDGKAGLSLCPKRIRHVRLASSDLGRVDIRGARSLGELAVHRESLERILMENPQSLQVILDVLLDALRQEIPAEAAPGAVARSGSRDSARSS